MIMQKIYWKSYAKTSRQDILFNLPRLINSYGLITNSTLLSDYCINFVIEVEMTVLNDFVCELQKQIEFTLIIPERIDSEIIMIYLSVAFKNASGDLKNLIPNVPGG